MISKALCVTTLVFAVVEQHVFCATEISPAMCEFERTVNKKKFDNENVTAKLETTDKPCLREIGDDSQFLYVKRDAEVDLKICFDAKQAKTFYVKFVIDGPAMAKNGKPDERPAKFMVGENRTLFPDHLPCFYKKSHQKALFEKYYGKADGIDQLSFLAKGHLASNGDFLTAEQKEGSFYYANVTPQWQAINSKAWKHVESSVRRLAKNTASKLTVYTGTHGQIAVRGKLVYLTVDDRVPVPEWLWKVVIDEKTDQGIGILCTNDPFNEHKPPCGSHELCDEINWKNFGNKLPTGKVYCCTVKELIAAIPEASEIQEQVTDVLRGPLLSISAVSQLKVKADRYVKEVKEKIKKKKSTKKDEKPSSESGEVADRTPRSPSRSPSRSPAKSSARSPSRSPSRSPPGSPARSPSKTNPSPRRSKSKNSDPDFVAEES